MEYTPLRGKVLCRTVAVDDHFQGSPILLLPDRVDAETRQQAEVVAIGADVEGLQVGDWVVHEPFARTAFGDDASLFLLTADAIVAVIQE